MPRYPRGASTQAVLFDLDGTLLDSFEQYWRALTAALVDFDFDPPPVPRIRGLIGLPGLEVIRAVGVPSDQARDVWTRWAEWEGRLADLVHPFPGILHLLERLRGTGYSLAIVTSRPRFSLDITPAALDLVPAVDLLVTRDDTAEGKPHPAPILLALQRLEVSPAHGVYVGDARYDIEAGHRAGCLTVLATWGRTGHNPLATPKPDLVAASPDALAAWLLD